MSNKRKLKAISFSIDDEYEYGLLQYIDNMKNFSGYVKRLINDDMRGKNKTMVQYELPTESLEDNYNDETKEAMSSFF